MRSRSNCSSSPSALADCSTPDAGRHRLRRRRSTDGCQRGRAVLREDRGWDLAQRRAAPKLTQTGRRSGSIAVPHRVRTLVLGKTSTSSRATSALTSPSTTARRDSALPSDERRLGSYSKPSCAAVTSASFAVRGPFSEEDDSIVHLRTSRRNVEDTETAPTVPLSRVRDAARVLAMDDLASVAGLRNCQGCRRIRSIPTQRRPILCATAAVVPEPRKQSSTMSPGLSQCG